MKVGILSDIHGNDFALEACLITMESLRVEKLLLLGDFVGYYYNAIRVFELLQRWDVESIAGNHDRMLIRGIENPSEMVLITQKYGHGCQIASETLSSHQIDWLGSLEDTKTVEIEKVRFYLSHGSPTDPNQYVYPDSDRITLENCGCEDADVVLMGHTHYSFCANADGALLINPGSIGQPRDHALPSFSIFNTKNLTITTHRQPYDKRELKKQVAEIDPNLDYLQNVLDRGP